MNVPNNALYQNRTNRFSLPNKMATRAKHIIFEENL